MLSVSDMHQRMAGVVCHVDTLARELHVCCDGQLMVFDLPPGCAVILNGERVKLRLLQPLDAVEIDCVPDRNCLTAHSVRVGWRGVVPGEESRTSPT
ncbi:MAG: hypothetical protein K2R98_21030 [Gemmataceae bacterium]|nr:hypothetical protein [Gemmataceae bacterium]